MKAVDNYHILVSPISDKVYIGTIKIKQSEKLGKSYAISENKVDRTSEFLAAIAKIYKNSSWRITGEDPLYCSVIDEATLKKNKNKTLGEFFQYINDAKGRVSE